MDVNMRTGTDPGTGQESIGLIVKILFQRNLFQIK